MNRLAAESSLYLKQHANNPVDWYPWGPEALDRAVREVKPIFLSIGYSACHWCHVMEHESFESEATAAILNEHFVCIKVDREERPDLDQIYMTAHHLLNRGEGGGWPLSVFLAPDQTPFYAGTYFPPDERYAPSRPSFPRLLNSLAYHWQHKREGLTEIAGHVAAHLNELTARASSDGPLSPAWLLDAERSLKRSFDSTNGGFGHRPKFPHPMELAILMRIATRDRDSKAMPMVELTLQKMARGGIYDQIGGGFARYSVDDIWLVPHFEKMLYDNALLPPVYAEAFRATGNGFYRQIATETLDWVLAEMTHSAGGFYSTLDADSEGEEGKFYVWSEEELDRLLDGDDARFAKAIYGTSVAGNFEGHNILFRWRSDAEDAVAQRMKIEDFVARLHGIKKKLYEARSKRIWPGRDEKIVTAWNGLMIAAMARCGAAFGEARFVDAAQRSADFVLATLRDANGRLFRTWGDGAGAKLTGYLEDYSYLIDALVSLYEATFLPKYLEEAANIAEAMIAHFADPAGGFFFTSDDHEKLLTRTKDMQDGSVPSGNSMAATGLIRLGTLLARRDFVEHAERTLKAYRHLLEDSPMAAGQMLVAFDWHLGPIDELALICSKLDERTAEALRAIRAKYLPRSILAFHDPADGEAELPLLANKPMIDGLPTLYVCRGQTCGAPLAGVDAIRTWLGTA